MDFRCQCGAIIGAESPKPILAEPNQYLYITFRGLDMMSFHRVSVLIFFNKIMNNVLMGIKELSGSIGPWAMLEDVEKLEDDQTIG